MDFSLSRARRRNSPPRCCALSRTRFCGSGCDSKGATPPRIATASATECARLPVCSTNYSDDEPRRLRLCILIPCGRIEATADADNPVGTGSEEGTRRDGLLLTLGEIAPG